MIKDILQQLAPLDEKIAALRGDPADENMTDITCLLYTSPSPRDVEGSRMPSSA